MTGTKLPFISIVIPCRNEEAYISACLDSFLQGSYPLDKMELLVCDGDSDDNTVGIIKQYAEKYDSVNYLRNERRTTPFALNLGLRAGKGSVKFIFGAHAKAHPDFVLESVKVLMEKEDVGCAGGIIENVYLNTRAEEIGLAMSSSFGVGNAHFRTGGKSGYVDTVAFGAYKQEVFDAVGYFDDELTRNQDDEFNFRVLKGGFKIWLSDRIKSEYFVRGSFAKLYKQYLQYGYWKVFVNVKHRTVTTWRQLVPLGLVLYGLLFPLFFLLPLQLTALYAAGWVFYGLAGLFFASRQAQRLGQVLPVLFSFFILHLAYGWGYLKGIVNFILLGKGPEKSQTHLTR